MSQFEIPTQGKTTVISSFTHRPEVSLMQGPDVYPSNNECYSVNRRWGFNISSTMRNEGKN